MMIRAAAGTYLMNFYNGIENMLKRIHKLMDVNLPKGENWHTELFARFCPPGFENLPILFDPVLENELTQYRKFRHLFIHGYGFQLEWEFMKEGVYMQIASKVHLFLNSIRK